MRNITADEFLSLVDRADRIELTVPREHGGEVVEATWFDGAPEMDGGFDALCVDSDHCNDAAVYLSDVVGATEDAGLVSLTDGRVVRFFVKMPS